MEANKFTDEKLVPAIGSLEELIEHLRLVFASDEVNVEYVKAVLAAYKSNPKDWKTFAKFDTHRYTRNLVDTGNGKYNLIALCWGEGQGSAVHDHSDAHCFVKILDGTLKETRFAWPEVAEGQKKIIRNREELGVLKQTSEHFADRDDVTYMSDSLGLHRVENPSHTKPAVSLHLYSPPFEFCQVFDQRTGAKTKVQMTFWSKFGQRQPFGETIKSNVNSRHTVEESKSQTGESLVVGEKENFGAVKTT